MLSSQDMDLSVPSHGSLMLLLQLLRLFRSSGMLLQPGRYTTLRLQALPMELSSLQNVCGTPWLRLIVEPALGGPSSSGSSGPSIGVGAIVGIVAAVLIIIGACVVGILIFRTKRKPKERVKLDSESDLPLPKDPDEKSIFRDATSSRRGSHTTDATHFDVPLTFAGGAPDTPRSSAVPVETARMYVGPPRPSTAQSSDTSKTSLDYSKGPRSAYQPHDTVPPSPKLPNGALASGWQSGPSQRSQQVPPAVPTVRGPPGQPSAYDRPSRMENGGQPEPVRNRSEQSAGRPPMDPRGNPRNQPPYPQDPRYQPTSRNPMDQQQRMPQPVQLSYPQGQPQGQSPYPQGQSPFSQGQSPYSQGQSPYPQSQSPYPQGQQAARIPQAPVPRPQYDQRPPSRNQQERPRSPRTAVPPPLELTQPPSPKKPVDVQGPSRKPVNQPGVPALADRGPPILLTPVPVESQPVASFSRQNSRRGQIPPFPLDPLTRKPTVTKKVETTPAVKVELPKESEVDIPSDSDETPPPQKVSPITPTIIPAIKVAEYNRPPSAKSHMARIEKEGSKGSIVVPPSPTKAVAPSLAAARPMGTGFEGASVPTTTKLPTVGAVPSFSTIPPSPSPTATQFTKETESPKKPEPNTLTPTKPKPDYTGSVTADILRMSVADTDTSGRTSMLVESQSERNSLSASTTFEAEGTTAPLVISKKDPESPVVKKDAPVAARLESVKPTESENKPMEKFNFQLPALEQGSFFDFDDLN
jgi:hypothetical protein